ncbi:Hsp70 protein-domain-containing protein [Melampsora americana]|nr:Hsp70 protein-domain-containing protein [Melampsora americana]
MSPIRLLSFTILSLSTFFLPTVFSRGILAIDYGAQYMQVSLVQPGLSFDVLLNHDSKRKTQSVVSIRGEDKLIGDDAAALAGRYPQNSYPSMKLLLGQPADSPLVKFHQSLYNIPLNITDRGTLKLIPNLPIKPNQTQIGYQPEELLALQFTYARELADAASLANPNPTLAGAGERIVDAIITVPGFFNQFERKAILDAAELAGLKVLTLIDDGSSVAVNYAMMRTFGNKASAETHLIYDVGAASIKASVVGFCMEEEKIHATSKIKKNVTMIELKGFGFEREFGGFYFDRKIRDRLQQDFETQHKVKVAGNDRAMIKLLREAGRVKHVLSANAESQSRIEGLVDDLDFKSSITRQDFEALFADETSKFTQPILDALKSANLTLADIKSVILVGGSSRVPMIQTAVKALVGEDKVAVNVNADEAAVMGAALYGAGISRQFKTKDIRITTVTPHSISASYNVSSIMNTTPTGQQKTLKSTLFKVGSKLGGKKKVMKIKVQEDISILFEYDNQPSYFPNSILNATIHGISAALTNYTNSTGITVPIKNSTASITIRLDDFGILTVSEASLLIPAESNANPGIADKIAGFFGGSTKKDEGEGEEIVEEGEKKETETKKNNVEKAKEALKAENKAADEAAKAGATKLEDVVVKLQIVRQELGIRPMSTMDRISSGKLLRELKAAETRKKTKEEARNVLEAYTYKLRDRITQDVYKSFSTEEELAALEKSREEVSDWLNDWGESAPVKELKSKKTDLEGLEKKITDRIMETEKRPEAYKGLEAALDNARAVEKSIQEKVGSNENPLNYTTEDVEGLKKLIEDQTKWFVDIKSKQDEQDQKKDVLVKVSELGVRTTVITAEVKKLLGRKVKKSKAPPYNPKAEKGQKAEPTGQQPPKDTEGKQQEQEQTKEEETKEQQKSKVETPPVKDEL